MATVVRRRLGVTPGHFFQLGGDCGGRLLLRRRGFLQRPETREGRDAEHVLLSDLVEMGEGERSHGIDGLCRREKLKVHLKPQDSFGRFVKSFLDLQKVDHIIRKHH